MADPITDATLLTTLATSAEAAAPVIADATIPSLLISAAPAAAETAGAAEGALGAGALSGAASGATNFANEYIPSLLTDSATQQAAYDAAIGTGGTFSDGMMNTAPNWADIATGSNVPAGVEAGGYSPSFMDQLKNYPKDVLDWIKKNKMSTAGMAYTGFKDYKAMQPKRLQTQAPQLIQGKGSFAVPDFHMAEIPQRKEQLYSLLG